MNTFNVFRTDQFKDFQMFDGHRNAFCPFSRFFEDQLHF